MGEVYCAHDARLGRDVAVKVLPEQLANSAKALARFEREAKALAALSHLNLVVIFDVGRDQGISFAVCSPEIATAANEVIHIIPQFAASRPFLGGELFQGAWFAESLQVGIDLPLHKHLTCQISLHM